MSGAGVSSLFADLDVRIETDAPIGASTWIGIGGRADVLVHPSDAESLATLVKRCRRTETPVRVLGAGANLLVADEGVDGVIVRLDAPEFRKVKYNARGDLRIMKAMSGADMARTLMDATRRGLEGLSQMAGIPASIGGAVRMNAGGAFGCIGDAVHSVACITREGEIVVYPGGELVFEYRRTNIPDPIILWATFELVETDPIALRERVKEIFTFKKSSQPLAESSAGCAFRNPVDPSTGKRCSAGRLIDEAGLKGERVGGAHVSEQHANFVVTDPGATARDVLALLDRVRDRVYASAGIELEREIVVWQRGDGGTDV